MIVATITDERAQVVAALIAAAARALPGLRVEHTADGLRLVDGAAERVAVEQPPAEGTGASEEPVAPSRGRSPGTAGPTTAAPSTPDRPKGGRPPGARELAVARAAEVMRQAIDDGVTRGFGPLVAKALDVHPVTAGGYVTEVKAKGLVEIPRRSDRPQHRTPEPEPAPVEEKPKAVFPDVGPIGPLGPVDVDSARGRAADVVAPKGEL